MIFDRWRANRRAAKKFQELRQGSLEIIRRYADRLPPDVAPGIEDDYRFSQENYGLMILLDWLYNEQIEPSETEKQIILELGKILRMPPEELYFWPQVKANKPLDTENVNTKAQLSDLHKALLTHLYELIDIRKDENSSPFKHLR